MTTFQTVLADVFDRGAERRIEDPSEERALIEAAKTGDEAATIALVYAYAPALRKAARTFGTAMDADDVRSAAALGLLQAIQASKPDHDRLAAVVVPHVVGALAEAASETAAVHVPARTMTRFWGVLRRAEDALEAEGGEVTSAAIEARALAIAPDYDLSREAFHAIIRAVRTEHRDDMLDDPAGYSSSTGPTGKGREAQMTPLWDEFDGIADAEDRILAEVALAAVEDDERDVCRHSYGFESYRPKSDAEVAYDLGLSRPTVQRKRAAALSKMRDRLAIDV